MKFAIRTVVLLVALSTTMAFADTMYVATLKGSNEVPATPSTATGQATFFLSGDLLTVNLSFTGLTGGNASAAHIHCCAPIGTNAPVIVPFTAFPASTSGSYTNTFNLLTLLGSAGEASLIQGLNTGQAYANIHDAVYGGGEIRGQIAVVTPEPSSLMLLSTGALGLAGVVRRRFTA